MCLLAQINPLKASDDNDEEVRPVQLHHAHQVCGIVAHTKDHGVASVAIRSLAIAGSVLREPRAQHEVLDILTRIYHHTGWNLNRVHLELKRAWGWEPPDPSVTAPAGSGPGNATAGLPYPASQHLAAQGGTLGAAAVINQLFGPRSSDGCQHQDAGRHLSQPPPAPIHPPAMATPNETRRANFTAGPPPPPMTLTKPLFYSSSSSLSSARQHGGGGGGGASNHTSPTTMSTTAHTPASMSSATNNAPTPPSARPTVNPLLAQADFTQPNHPYRDWYKPPERTGGAPGTFKTGGLWPY